MATDATKQQTQVLVSTAAQAFNPPRLKAEPAKAVKAMKPGQRPVLDTYQDRRGRFYAFDGVSIRRVR